MKKVLLTFFILLLSSNLASAQFTGKATSEWDDGYCYSFYIINDTSDVIKDWNIIFDMDKSSSIYNKWS